MSEVVTAESRIVGANGEPRTEWIACPVAPSVEGSSWVSIDASAMPAVQNGESLETRLRLTYPEGTTPVVINGRIFLLEDPA